MKRFLSYDWLVHLLAAGGALGIALISQYGFSKFPCHLCMLQRYPYAAVLVLVALMRLFQKRQEAQPVLRGLIFLSYLATMAIAAYHVGVEQGWIQGPSGCAANTGGAATIEELKQQIMNSTLVSCKDAASFLFGISMAAWNTLYAAFLAAATVWIWNRKKH